MTTPAVLIVDDDPARRLIMQMLLGRRMGLEHISIFADSTDFAGRVSALTPRPALIFLDIHVKPLDGFEMFHEIRRLRGYASVPVIALTASVMSHEVAQIRSWGFCSLIAKPVDLEAFPETFTRLLAGEQFWGIMGQ